MTTFAKKYPLDEEIEHDTAMDAGDEIDVEEMDDNDLGEPTWIVLQGLGIGG